MVSLRAGKTSGIHFHCKMQGHTMDQCNEYLQLPWHGVSIKKHLLGVSSGGRFLSRWFKEHLRSRGAWKNVFGEDLQGEDWRQMDRPFLVDWRILLSGLKKREGKWPWFVSQNFWDPLLCGWALAGAWGSHWSVISCRRPKLAARETSLKSCCPSGAKHWVRALSSWDV